MHVLSSQAGGVLSRDDGNWDLHNPPRADHEPRRPQRTLMVVALLACSLPLPAWAANLAYIRASSQYERKTHPATYHPLNLLDDDPATIWCEGASGLGENQSVRIFFKRPQPIDRIDITPALQTGRLILKVSVTDGTNTVHLELGDKVIEQPVHPPMRGQTYVVTIDEVDGPNKTSKLPHDVACIADVMLYMHGRAFGGGYRQSSLHYNGLRDHILGRWSGAPLGAPEKFIIFAIDGTWEWSYHPLLGGHSRHLAGEYRFRDGRLLMRTGEAGRWSTMRFSYHTVHITPGDINAPLGDYQVIELGDTLGGTLAGDYNNARF